MICVLKVLRGPSTRSRYVLKENQHVEIGRSTSADISLPSDAHLSRRHVLVDSFGDGFWICDLGSVNGTFLNEERVKRASLKNGDVIRIGMTQFRVTMMANDANPHAEDGVQFSSSVYHALESKQASGDRPERSVSFPKTILDEEITRCAPQPEDEASEAAQDKGVAERQEAERQEVKRQEAEHVDLSVRPNPTSAPRTMDATIVAVSHPFARFFSACEQPNLYTLGMPVESPWGEFVSLLMSRPETDSFLAIFNTTQVPSREAALLDRKFRENRLVSISKTILAGHLSTSEDDLSLMSACTHCDGLICIGSARRIDAEEIRQFANSFSYPSLFGEHMKDGPSPLRYFLLGCRAWVLFEWSRNGPLGLFAPDLFRSSC